MNQDLKELGILHANLGNELLGVIAELYFLIPLT